MKIAERIKAALKGWGGLDGNPGPHWTWNKLFGTLPGSRFDYAAEVGDPLLCGPVSICAAWVMENFPEAELRVNRGLKDGVPNPVTTHPLLTLLEKPNPYYDRDSLLGALAVSYKLSGNAYALKVRNALGLVKELWFLPHTQVEPRWHEGGEFISHYAYTANGQETILLKGDVLHFRFGLDPSNPRLGFSPLRALMRELYCDNQLSALEGALLRNMGLPAVLITPTGEGAEFTQEQADHFKTQYQERYTGEGAGLPLVPSIPVKVERLGLAPGELQLDKLRQVPEDRICGAFRISPMVVHLTGGSEHKTYANYSEARRAAYEDALMPMARRFARTLAQDPDLGVRPGEEVAWDYSRVAAFSDDLDAIYARCTEAVQGGWMMLSEARSRAGLAHLPGTEVFLTSYTHTPGRDKDPGGGGGGGKRASKQTARDVAGGEPQE